MATIREWLTEAGFDFEGGRFLFQPTDGASPGWADPIIDGAAFIPMTHAILDRKFDSGYGGPECPRFVAEDAHRIYFPTQYDGATSLEWVYKDLSKYLKEASPYPGG